MRNPNFATRFLIAAACASLIPCAALACPACMVGDPKTAATYFGMTVVMSALPILLVCGLGYWIWRRHS
jgi:membrane protein DedA with SNARE-associated domain